MELSSKDLNWKQLVEKNYNVIFMVYVSCRYFPIPIWLRNKFLHVVFDFMPSLGAEPDQTMKKLPFPPTVFFNRNTGMHV